MEGGVAQRHDRESRCVWGHVVWNDLGDQRGKLWRGKRLAVSITRRSPGRDGVGPLVRPARAAKLAAATAGLAAGGGKPGAGQRVVAASFRGRRIERGHPDDREDQVRESAGAFGASRVAPGSAGCRSTMGGWNCARRNDRGVFSATQI